MKWRTEVKLNQESGYLDYRHDSLSIGSCFSDKIGKRLKDHGFNISVNPFGVIFNPVSIFRLLENAQDRKFREDLIIERDQKFYHYGYHSEVFGTSKEELLEKIRGLQLETENKLVNADHLFLTFGTAWAWRLESDQSVVANCHKMPRELFSKELIDLNKLEAFSIPFFEKLFEKNPKLKVTLTVSPVRHTKQGLHENNLSKGLLHLFCNKLVSKFNNIQYFPAYELVVDELRDYRFFKDDLIHPSEQAIEYVFDKFRDTYFDEKTAQRFELHAKIRKAESHDFMNASEAEKRKHEAHLNQLRDKLTNLG